MSPKMRNFLFTNSIVAAGIYPTIKDAAQVMGKLQDSVVRPIPENRAVYDRLYAEYKALYDYFGRGANDDNPSVRTEASQALDKLGTVGVIVGVAAVMQRLLPSAPESANPALAR